MRSAGVRAKFSSEQRGSSTRLLNITERRLSHTAGGESFKETNMAPLCRAQTGKAMLGSLWALSLNIDVNSLRDFLQT